MSQKARELLFKISANVIKLTQPAQTTFSASTGALQPPTVYQPASTPNPIIKLPKYQG